MPNAYAKRHPCMFCGLVTKVANYHWRYWSKGQSKVVPGYRVDHQDAIRLAPHERSCPDRPKTKAQWDSWEDGPRTLRFQCCLDDSRAFTAVGAGGRCADCNIWRCRGHLTKVMRQTKEIREVAPGVYKPVDRIQVGVCKGGCKNRA